MLKLDKQSFFFFRVKKGDSPGVANIVHTPEPELHNNLCVLNLFCILATRIDILYVISWLNWGFGLLPSQKTPVFSESSMAYLSTMMMCQCLLNKPPDYIGPFPVSTSTVFYSDGFGLSRHQNVKSAFHKSSLHAQERSFCFTVLAFWCQTHVFQGKLVSV